MTATKPKHPNPAVLELAETLTSLSDDHLAALPAVLKAAQRGTVAMNRFAREEYELGMAAMERIVEAVRGGP